MSGELGLGWRWGTRVRGVRRGAEGGVEGGARQAILLAMSAGVKACVTHEVHVRWRSVPEQAGDEVHGVQAQRLGLLVVVIGVGHAHEVIAVDGQRAAQGHGPALDVARQVQGHAAGVTVGRLDLDVPVRAVELAQALVPVRRRLLGWQRQALLGQQRVQLSQQLAAKQVLQQLQRQQEAAAGGPPGAIRGYAAGAEQAVHVRVKRQIAAPGVQRHEQAWAYAGQPRRGHQLQQRVARTLHQQRSQCGAVVAPQRQQRVRQREDDVEVRARQ